MGNCCCFILSHRDEKKELNNHLIRPIYCDRCKQTYLSNYEYNKHIVRCNLITGDL